MASTKIYTIQLSRNDYNSDGNRVREAKGTLEELQDYFRNYFYNKPFPKTIKTLVKRVQEGYSEREAACYNRTHVELVSTKTVKEIVHAQPAHGTHDEDL